MQFSLSNALNIYNYVHIITFSPTNGNDHVNTSMKFGSQYGCGEQLNCRIFITLFSYLSTAAFCQATFMFFGGLQQRQNKPRAQQNIKCKNCHHVG